MAENLAAEAATLWGNVETVARAVALGEIKRALANLRPGGAHPFCWDGVPATVDTTLRVPVDYPCVITSVEICAQPGDAAEITLDVQTVRPGAALTTAASICGLTPPVLTAADRVDFPAGTDWTPYLEPPTSDGKTLLVVSLEAVSGTAGPLTITVHVRAL